MKHLQQILMVMGLVLSLAAAHGQASGAQTNPPAGRPITASSASAPIPPQQQATKEQIEKLFAAMRLRDQMESIIKMMPGMIQQQLASEPLPSPPSGADLTPEQEKEVRALLSKYVQKSMNLYTADEMMADMASIYRRHFTRANVDAYIAFYNSAPGQHLLAAQPAIERIHPAGHAAGSGGGPNLWPNSSGRIWTISSGPSHRLVFQPSPISPPAPCVPWHVPAALLKYQQDEVFSPWLSRALGLGFPAARPSSRQSLFL